MDTVAGDRLRGHFVRVLCVATQASQQIGRAFEGAEKILCLQLEGVAGYLTHSFETRSGDVVQQRDAGETFAADRHHFDRGSVVENVDERNHRGQRKMYALNSVGLLEQFFSQGERDLRGMLHDCRQLAGWQFRENFVCWEFRRRSSPVSTLAGALT